MIWQQGDRYYWLEQGVASSVSLDTILKSADGERLNGWMVHDEVIVFAPRADLDWASIDVTLREPLTATAYLSAEELWGQLDESVYEGRVYQYGLANHKGFDIQNG